DLGYETTIDLDTLIVNTNGKIHDFWTEVPKICNENGYQLKSYKPIKDALESLFIQLVSRKIAENGSSDLKEENK
ncbi:MAG: hypothetical protein ACW99Q_14875, partial [Candidatus Kariarchaeaceae archaeon]